MLLDKYDFRKIERPLDAAELADDIREARDERDERDVLLGLGGAIHDNLDFLNNTKVPIYITGLGKRQTLAFSPLFLLLFHKSLCF